jgi:hypothetical protein
MTRWTIALAAILMLLASAAFGQGFVYTISYFGPPDYPDSPALTTTCNGATPLPDGRIIRIFQDIAPFGPDPTDPQPVVCADPPNCENGAFGTVNFNQFTTNGVASGYGQGYFYTARTWFSVGGIPTGSRNYYIRIYEPDGTTVIWTSATFFVLSGPQEYNFVPEEMTCGQGGAQCMVIDETE